MKKWIKSALYIPKHTKPTDSNIMRLLLPSFLGIVLCMICLAGMTWAWFSASVQTAPQTITAANYDITVTVTDEEGESVSLNKLLIAGQAYTVKLMATGTAKKFGGYCVVPSGGTSLYTVSLKPDDSLTFTLIPPENATYTFTAVWGSYSGKPNIQDGCTVGEKSGAMTAPKAPEKQQPETEGENIHVVQSGDSLWKIAQQYDTTVEKLTAYNDIDKDALLQIGQEVKIPPADYEIPEEPVSAPVEPTGTESVAVSNAESLSDGTTTTSGATISTEVDGNGTRNITSQ